MTKINHMKKVSKSEDAKSKDTKENDKRKYKKGDDSGSESDEEKKYSGSGSGSDGGGSDDGGGEKFDMLEYRKMLAEIFPSKYMNERISKLESKEKIAKSTSSSNTTACASNTSNKKSNKNENDKNKENKEDSNRKITRSMAKEMDIKPKELKSVEKGKKRGSHNPPPPPLPIQDEYDTSSTSTNCSDSEDEYSRSGSGSEDDKYSAGFGEFAKEQLQSGKFNIVINLVNDKKHSNLDEDDSEYDSEEEDSEYDSEDDSEYDDDDTSESDSDYNPDVDMDEGENTIVSNDIKDYKSGKSYKTSTHGGDRTSSDRGKIGGAGGSGGVVGAKGTVSTEAESLETIQKIKHQMEDILKSNKHDSIARETLGIMVKKEKEYKDREEKKIKSRQKNHVKLFKKMLRKKNSTNDLKYFKDNLTTEEQTDVLKELEDLNKLTITDKPYRLSLLQSDIPQAFKAIALKKITNLRHMEPGAGEYYKIKNWVDTFMQIPFGKNCNLPLTISDGIEKCHDFMENAKSTLDCAVYGLNDAKMQIMQMLGQWIANPAAMGTAIAINGPMGTGKCHAYDTQILMHDGSIKMVQDIVVGDKVMGDDSKCRNVISLGRGEDDMYDIVHLNGEKYGVNSEHIMCLKQSGMNIIKTVKTNSGGIRYKVIYLDKNDYKQHSKRFCELEDATRYLNDMKLEHDYIEIPVKTLLKLPKYISVNLKGYKGV